MTEKQEVRIQCIELAIDILTSDQFGQPPTVEDVLKDAKKLYDWVQG